MKNVGMKAYEEYSKTALNSGVDYKQDLIHKDRIFLLELCYQIIAYNVGTLMQAWKDYPRKNFQSKSIINLITKETEYYGEDSIKEARNKVDNQFSSSFDNKYSEKIKALNLTAELIHIIPTDEGAREEAKTLNEDFQKEWLPKFYNRLREGSAKSLRIKFKLNDKTLSDLRLLAFDEIISLVNRRKQTNKSLIQLLEQSIEVYFPMFLNDLGIRNKTNLVSFRKNSEYKFNTVCYRCGLKLLKKDKKHYCTRKENRSCYNARFKEDRDSGFPEAILRTKNKCDNCGKEHSPLNYIRTLKDNKLQFCSEYCETTGYETMRKRLQRAR